MKKKLTVLITLLFIFAACIPLLTVSADTPSYVTDGLEALYVGNNNTGSGQNKDATVWKDLSGKGRDITNVPKDATNYFTDTGYHLDTMKVYFPAAINDVVNGQEFTVEMVLGDITPKGSQFLTFINCPNDNFSLFRRNPNDNIEVKTNNAGADRPKKEGGLEYFMNSTVTITYKVGGNCTIYVDGEKIAEAAVSNTVNVDTGEGKFMWFGHDDATRNYETEFRSIRFYSKELTAAQVSANYEVDKEILGKPYQGGTSTDTSASESSAPASSSSSVASSSSASSASSASKVSSSTSSVSNPGTGDESVYAFAVIGFVALASAMVVIRNRRTAR